MLSVWKFTFCRSIWKFSCWLFVLSSYMGLPFICWFIKWCSMPVWDFICLIFDGYTLGVSRAFDWGMIDDGLLFADGTRLLVDGTRFSCEFLLICGLFYEFYLFSLIICWLLPSLNKSNTLLLSLISSISNLLITVSTNPSAPSKFILPFISILIFISSFHSSEGYVFELTISIKLLTMRSCWACGVRFNSEMGRGSMRLRAKLWLNQTLT